MSNEYLEPIDDIIQAFAEVHDDVSADTCSILPQSSEDTTFLQICVGGHPSAKDMVFRKMSADHSAGFGHDQRDMEYYSEWSDTATFGDIETLAMYRMNLNLVGIMDAQVLCLGFRSKKDFDVWKKSTEYDYLRYIKPWLKDKLICICANRASLEDKILTDAFFSDLNTVTYSSLVQTLQNGYQKYFMSDAYDLSRSLQEILYTEFDVSPVLETRSPFVDAMTPVPYVNENGELKDLLVGQTEITQALYESVMGVNPSRFKGSGELPVETVSWFDLLEFCNRLSAMQGFRPCYTIDGEDVEWDRSANGYRLPTEHEWEYIAKANRGFEYSGSDDVGAVAWYGGSNGMSTQDVGTKKENSFGTYDQSGNVWEWCWDLYDDDQPYRVLHRVLRGGCWYYSASYMRAASRYSNTPSFRNNGYGGRLARSPGLS